MGPIVRLASIAATGLSVPLEGELAASIGEAAETMEKLNNLDTGATGLENQPSSESKIEMQERDIQSLSEFLTAIDLDPRKAGMDIARAPDGRWLWMTLAEALANTSLEARLFN